MTTRRQVIGHLLGAGGVLCIVPTAVLATPAMRDAAIAELTGGAPVGNGRVTLTLPAIAENGLSVYTTVAVDSPMNDSDYVRAIHLLSEENPIARLATFHLGPGAGIARVSTNIRLAASQQVTALVEFSDGSFWQDRRDVVVTLAACIDGG
ncbi:MAG: thiosulfate oxidation carrier protein SoxY [Pseudomonadales bacterium]